MYIIMGKTASGKDTICNRLCKDGYKKITTYTTRPKRDGEIEDITYHFTDKSQFRRLIEQDFFVEYATYERVDGTKYYGTALKDIISAENNSIVILNPFGYKKLCEALKCKPKSIYIRANDETISERLAARGDDPREAERRLEKDNIDFKGIEGVADYVIDNNSGDNIDFVYEVIKNQLRKWDDEYEFSCM